TDADLPDPMPADVLERHGLLGLRDALRAVHIPDDDADWQRGQARLRYEEALVLQAALARRRATREGLTSVARPTRAGGLLDAFDAQLPFALTAGQVAAGNEIADDLAKPQPMLRLLQGDVGAGKTVVALRAMLQVVDAG